MTEILPIALIKLDGGTQSRDGLNTEIVLDYARDMREGAVFPPIIVYYDGAQHWLADGFHRLQAALKVQKESDDLPAKLNPVIACEVRQGTRRDAILHSVGANGSHGLRRTNADKRRAVHLLLTDEEWAKWSDNQIAKACGVAQSFVSGMRHELTYLGDRSNERKGADGRTINTANIGQAAKRDCPECGANNWWVVVPGMYQCKSCHHQFAAADIRLGKSPPSGKDAGTSANEDGYHAGDWRDNLDASSYYPLNRQLKIIVNETFRTGNELHRKYPWGQTRKTWQKDYGNAIRQNPEFADYRLIEPNELSAPDSARTPEDTPKPDETEAFDDWSEALLPDKYYAVNDKEHLIYDDPGTLDEVIRWYHDRLCTYYQGNSIVKGRQTLWRDAQLVPPDRVPERNPFFDLSGLMGGFKPGYYYPVDRFLRSVYNEPMDLNQAMGSGPQRYPGCRFINGHSINGCERFHHWSIVAAKCSESTEDTPSAVTEGPAGSPDESRIDELLKDLEYVVDQLRTLGVIVAISIQNKESQHAKINP